MERLTSKDEWGYYSPSNETLNCLKQRGRLIDRLAAYDNTGLMPESVEAFKLSMMGKVISEIKEFNGLSIDRLRDLAEADKEGRVVVLPCKVGDTVWRLQYVDKGNGTFPVEPVEQRFNLLTLPEFGETVFLTREEAEKALEARGDG